MNSKKKQSTTIVRRKRQEVSQPRLNPHQSLIAQIWSSIFYGYAIVIATVIVLFGILLLLRPLHPLKKVYRPGIWYERLMIGVNNQAIAHVFHIDLSKNEVHPLVTPLEFLPNRGKTVSIPARTTTSFLEEFDLQVALNGSYFYPQFDYGPWHSYPREGDPVTPIGSYIVNGIDLTLHRDSGCSLCIAVDDSISMETKSCPANTKASIGCGQFIIDNGELTIGRSDKYPNQPRTAMSVNTDENWIELIVVDGRQFWYSAGITALEFASFIKDRGAEKAVIFDGGGSSTLVVQEPWGPRILNVPVNSMIPFRQRPLATHVGFHIKQLHESE